MNEGNQWVKMLINAKTQAEEGYRNSTPPKFTIRRSQVESLRGFYSPEKFEDLTAWLNEMFDIQEDGELEEIRRDIQASWDRINEQLRDAYMRRLNLNYFAPQRGGKTWLGSQIEQRERERLQRGNRVEEVFEVPGVRGFGYSADKTYIDEACDWSAYHHGHSDGGAGKESDPALSAWLQRRSVCFRASSCGVA